MIPIELDERGERAYAEIGRSFRESLEEQYRKQAEVLQKFGSMALN